MKDVFIDVEQHLHQIPGLYVAEDWGQLNFEKPPVNFPCALIDLGEAKYSQVGNRFQMAEATLNIILADVQFQGIVPTARERDRQRAFGIFNLIDKIHSRLHGQQGDRYSPLTRLEVKKIMRPDLIREFVMVYRFGYTDTSASSIYGKVTPDPEIRVDVRAGQYKVAKRG